jgi:hypothetical protein
VHEYFALNWRIVWVAATQDAPLLWEQMAAILEKEFSDKRTYFDSRGDSLSTEAMKTRIL